MEEHLGQLGGLGSLGWTLDMSFGYFFLPFKSTERALTATWAHVRYMTICEICSDPLHLNPCSAMGELKSSRTGVGILWCLPRLQEVYTHAKVFVLSLCCQTQVRNSGRIAHIVVN